MSRILRIMEPLVAVALKEHVETTMPKVIEQTGVAGTC